MANSLKLKVKINKREPIITILDFQIKINVITCTVANKFGLAIK